MTYGSLLDDNVLDEEVLELKIFRVRVRLGILQETKDELDGLLRPATYPIIPSLSPCISPSGTESDVP